MKVFQRSVTYWKTEQTNGQSDWLRSSAPKIDLVMMTLYLTLRNLQSP